MRNDWIIDVLTDLRGYAQGAGYDRLARRIDDALAAAEGEIPQGGAPADPAPDVFPPARPRDPRPH